MKQYICVKAWARNKVNDVIDEWTFKKYPEELRHRCFKVIEPKPTPVVDTTPPVVVETPKVEPVVVAEPVRVEAEVELVVEVASPEDSEAETDFEKKFKKKSYGNL